MRAMLVNEAQRCAYHGCSICCLGDAQAQGDEYEFEPQIDEYLFQRGAFTYTVRGAGTLGHFDYEVACDRCENVVDGVAREVAQAIKVGDHHIDYKHSAAWPVTLPVGELPHEYLPLFHHALVVINNHMAGRFISEAKE